MKTHFSLFTGPATPVSLNALPSLGVPAWTVIELIRRGLYLSAERAGLKGGDRD